MNHTVFSRLMMGIGLVLTIVVITGKVVAIMEPPANPAPSSAAGELVWSKWLARELDAESEHILFGGQRVDILMLERAIEVEWCRREKIHEAVEQARFYSVATGRPGCIVLLVGRGDFQAERVAYGLFVEAAARGNLHSVAVLDVRNPQVGECCEHLGLVPTPAPEP